MFAATMKPRQDRGNPMASVKKGPQVDNQRSGALGPNHTSQWKAASQKTMAELASMGKLEPNAVQYALRKGHITPATFKQVFWDIVDIAHMTKEQMNLVNCFADVLF